jgi:hypothetical protein
MTYNTHLLQIKLTAEKYRELTTRHYNEGTNYISDWLPEYLIARCPFCLKGNIERLDTYSIGGWSVRHAKALYSHRLVVFHCQHFVLAQPFFHFHEVWPVEAKGMFTPEVPHVIGHLLENKQCLAVIHALPICRIEDNMFVPRYTLFMISYFSIQPDKSYNSVITFNVDYIEEGIAWPFIAPPEGYESWWNLNPWVSRNQLYWIDSDDPELSILTGSTDGFPYSHISGRTWPYLHTFPYPLPKQREKTNG